MLQVEADPLLACNISTKTSVLDLWNIKRIIKVLAIFFSNNITNVAQAACSKAQSTHRQKPMGNSWFWSENSTSSARKAANSCVPFKNNLWKQFFEGQPKPIRWREKIRQVKSFNHGLNLSFGRLYKWAHTVGFFLCYSVPALTPPPHNHVYAWWFPGLLGGIRPWSPTLPT